MTKNDHTDRSDEQLQNNRAGAGIITDLALIQDIPDASISLSAQPNKRIRVKRNGVLYGIDERSGPRSGGKYGSYVYAVGAELDGNLQFPHLSGNCFGSLHKAIHALRKVILWDPRQADIPAHHRATHFRFEITPATSD